MNDNDKPLVHIGWLLATHLQEANAARLYEESGRQLQSFLHTQFPQFTWRISFLERPHFSPQGVLDPLPVLEFGLQEKTARFWDYAVVLVTNELLARERVHTIGVPSSALETAVLSTAALHPDSPQQFSDCIVALALHLLGHIWGAKHANEGPMTPPEDPACIRLSPFPPDQQAIIIDRLEEVADQRLEEQADQWNPLSFYWRAFWADPKSILNDIFGYKPWRLPLRMGRLTAATAVSLIFLLLAAEAWEIGVNLSPGRLIGGSVITVLIATGFIFAGQNLNQISRQVGWREQLTRTRLVILGTVFLGMVSLWLVLFFVSILVGWLLPEVILEGWVKQSDLTQAMLLRHAAFMAMLGVLAGALGGNLEEQDVIKAELLFDEET
jgi:hypothetical protein